MVSCYHFGLCERIVLRKNRVSLMMNVSQLTHSLCVTLSFSLTHSHTLTCGFHFLTQATASFDATWRMWDVETGACLMEQEGHSRPVYTVAFHPDGSLAASAGLDSIGGYGGCVVVLLLFDLSDAH